MWTGTMDEYVLESSRVSDDEQHPMPSGEGGHVTEAPVQQDREPHLGGQAGLGAAALALILLGLSIDRLRAPTAPSSTPSPAPTAVPFAPLSGPSMMATAVLGTPARLVQPLEAVLLPHGQIAVADTGNRRLAILDATGHLLRSVRTGALQEPYAVVASSHALFVLDAGRGSIERYDLAGRFEREIISNPPLLASARGMALGPDGTLYVANPRSNSVVLLSPSGHILRQVTSPLGAGPDQLNQPSDVAVSPNDTVYVLDNMNNRIKALTATGAFIAQWSAPPSDTLHSVHVLPLRGGRILASDPFTGALLLYGPGGGVPVRVPLRVPGQAAGSVQPLGLSLGPGGNVLVTDGHGNRLLLVSSSEL